MKFYKKSNGKWVIGNYTGVPIGTCSEHTDPATGRITIRGNGIMYADNVLPTEFQKENGDYYSDLAEYENATKDFFVKAPASGGGSMTDFLLVTSWQDNTGVYPSPDPQMLDGDIMIYINPQNETELSRFNSSIADWDIIHPIPQTTIFVHPTTSERYKFNGTAMEVYNDVNGIVPKWFEYKAYAKQLNGQLICYRTNIDENNAIGDINWFSNSVDPYWSSNKYINIDPRLLDLKPINVDGSSTMSFSLNVNGEGLSFDKVSEGFDWNGIYLNFKQRLRGAPPKLLNAETNETGDKVILTFDKKMSGYGLGSMSVIECATVSHSVLQSGTYTVIDNVVIVDMEQISTTDELFVRFYVPVSTDENVESLDYGLLQPFENFPVTNNVPAPPQLLDAYTDITGTILYMTFDKEMDVDLNSWYAFGWNSGIEVGHGNYSYNPITKTLSAQIISTISAGEPLTLSYDITRGHLKSMDGIELQPFSDYTVTNNIQ